MISLRRAVEAWLTTSDNNIPDLTASPGELGLDLGGGLSDTTDPIAGVAAAAAICSAEHTRQFG